jgi:hypothetical protein
MTCTVCARKELIEKIVRNHEVWEQGFKMGDYPRWLLIAMASKIGYLDVSTATRRELTRSDSMSPDIRKRYAFFLAIQDIREYFMRLRPPSTPVQERVRGDFHKTKLQFGYLMQDTQIARESHAYLADRSLLSVTDRLHWLGSRGAVRHRMAAAIISVKNWLTSRGVWIPSVSRRG